MIINPIPALNDNYIWMIVQPELHQALVVDPGEAQPVIKSLLKQELTLAGILLTHHHWDHTNGIRELLDFQKVPVYGSTKDQVPGCDHLVDEGDHISFDSLGWQFSVLAIPGHTLGHIAYVGAGIVFCGDTLFMVGCGRLFEGTAEQMLHSLNKLKSLPPDTLVYCAHEYTLANCHFAQSVEPNNKALIKRITETKALRDQGKPTVPAPLALELATNPFLRCDQKSVQMAAEQHAGHSLTNEVEVFACLRAWKDSF